VTSFPELDTLLAELVAGQRAVLGENFVGTYLAGSFALGAGDQWSDVDFLTVVERALTADEEQRLNELHRHLFTRDTVFARHLEGSYAPRADVRRKSDAAWPFLDNGSTELTPDTHCNSQVTRWNVLQGSVTLAGPEPAALIDPVAPDDLRSEARKKLREYVEWAHAPHVGHLSGMSRWQQPYIVLTLCRLLRTIESGRVHSKREGGEWAIQTLDPQWRDLIAGALADRPNPWERVHQDSTPELVARTRAFADSVVA